MFRVEGLGLRVYGIVQKELRNAYADPAWSITIQCNISVAAVARAEASFGQHPYEDHLYGLEREIKRYLNTASPGCLAVPRRNTHVGDKPMTSIIPSRETPCGDQVLPSAEVSRKSGKSATWGPNKVGKIEHRGKISKGRGRADKIGHTTRVVPRGAAGDAQATVRGRRCVRK